MDLVVEAPDGTRAASCLGWWDPATLTAEVEPLGVVAAHRRLGLARALWRAVSDIVAQWGGREVFINTGPRTDYPAPAAAYARAGFQVVPRGRWFRLQSASNPSMNRHGAFGPGPRLRADPLPPKTRTAPFTVRVPSPPRFGQRCCRLWSPPRSLPTSLKWPAPICLNCWTPGAAAIVRATPAIVTPARPRWIRTRLIQRLDSTADGRGKAVRRVLRVEHRSGTVTADRRLAGAKQKGRSQWDRQNGSNDTWRRASFDTWSHGWKTCSIGFWLQNADETSWPIWVPK